MGEVVEICAVVEDFKIYRDLLDILMEFTGRQYRTSSIQVMDDWEYTNVVDLESVDDYFESDLKGILTLECESDDDHVGASIEKPDNGYLIEAWLNPHGKVIEEEYKKLLDVIKKRLQNEARIYFCAIGQEIFIDTELNFLEMLKTAHNIDLWMIKRELWNSDYREFVGDDHMLIG